MKRSALATPLFCILFYIGLSCNSSYRSTTVQYNDYRVTSETQNDPNLLALIRPYSDSVNKSMNDVVGIAEKSLEKKQPECTLGNFMADALCQKALPPQKLKKQKK